MANQPRPSGPVTTQVPEAAKEPSLGRASGTRSGSTRSQVAPPSSVRISTNSPSTESLKAKPRSRSQNERQSKKASGSALRKTSSQLPPPSAVR